jgi:glycosyltransferase involved in cell wall biosynthesis
MNILFVTSSIPWPPTDGMRIKTYNLLRQLSKRHKLYLLSFYESVIDNPAEAAEHLEQFCNIIDLIPFSRKKLRSIRILLNMANVFKKDPFFVKEYNSIQMEPALINSVKDRKFDIIHFDTISTSRYKSVVPDMPAVLSLNDCTSLTYRDEALLFPNKNLVKKIKRIMQWITVHNYEKKMCEKFQKCHVVAETDKNYLMQLSSQIDVEVIPNGVDTDFYRPLNLEPDYPSLVFEGVMRYCTADYAMWFIDYVFPLVTKVIADIKLYLVGKEPDQKLLKIASRNKNIIVTGYVEDVRPYIDRATLFVCPFLRSSGILNKILQAMAMEKAVVGTTYGFSGIRGCVNGQNMMSAKNPYEFATAIINLINNRDKRKQIGKNARKLVNNNYSWEKTANSFERLYEETIEKSAGPARKTAKTKNIIQETVVCRN